METIVQISIFEGNWKPIHLLLLYLGGHPDFIFPWYVYKYIYVWFNIKKMCWWNIRLQNIFSPFNVDAIREMNKYGDEQHDSQQSHGDRHLDAQASIMHDSQI